MTRIEAIRLLAKHRGSRISVATMQSIAPWHDADQATAMHIDASGCMGSASSIGLGLAIGCPHIPVLVLDGDGSLLMQLGSLVTVASLGPQNFYHFVFGNGVYQSTGNQALPGKGKADYCALASAAGYRQIQSIHQADELDQQLPGILSASGPSFTFLEIDMEASAPRWAQVPIGEQYDRLKEFLALKG